MHTTTHEPEESIRNFSPTADLAYAFGVKENIVRTCVMNELKNNGSNKRKQRTDAGEMLFNTDHKQGQTLKYNKPSINKLNIRAHLTDDELS